MKGEFGRGATVTDGRAGAATTGTRSATAGAGAANAGTGLGQREWLALAVGIAVAVAIRAILLPQPGLAGDDDGFLRWVRFVNRAGLTHAYDQPISFPAVVPWLWWILGSVAPGILNQAPNDPMALSLFKLPGALADFGIAAVVGWSLRARPGWAVAGILAVLLVPVTWYTSAWWGQLESLYVLPMVAAWLLVTRSRFGWAAVAIAIGLMAKPQALPLAIPFAAFYLRRAGLAGSIRGALIGAVTVVLLWSPFLAADGPSKYLTAVARYTEGFAFLSLRAWNPWWMLQELVAGDRLIGDGAAIAGPVTIRSLGIALAALLEVAVFLWVWRRPTPSGLAWGLAAASLAAFVALTEMHERYDYAAAIFLVLAWPDRLAVGSWILLATAISLNLVAAVPPGYLGPGSVIPVGGPLGLAGSLAITIGLGAVLLGLARGGPPGPPWAEDAPEPGVSPPVVAA